MMQPTAENPKHFLTTFGVEIQTGALTVFREMK